MGVENAAGYDGRLRFGGDETDTGFGGLQRAVGTTRAFGKERERAAGFERPQGALHRFDIGLAIAVDGDCSHCGHPRCAKTGLPEGFAREVGDETKHVAAEQRWVEVAGVVGGEDDGTVGGDVVKSLNVAFEDCPVEGSDEPEADPVDFFIEFHEERRASMMLATLSMTCSSVRSEESMTVAPSGI